jgi:hypothetical protein
MFLPFFRDAWMSAPARLHARTVKTFGVKTVCPIAGLAVRHTEKFSGLYVLQPRVSRIMA